MEDYICGTCKRYDSDNVYCPLHGTVYEEDTCDDWESDELTEEELEAQKVDSAEKETHRKEVEE